jgi:hypothetical protein
MKVRVFYNMMNQIEAIIEIKEEKGVAPAGIFPIPNCQSSDIELSAEQSKMSLLDLHVKHAVELKEGKISLISLKMAKPTR